MQENMQKCIKFMNRKKGVFSKNSPLNNICPLGEHRNFEKIGKTTKKDLTIKGKWSTMDIIYSRMCI